MCTNLKTLILLYILHENRDVKQVYQSRSIPYRGRLVIERVTAGMSRAGCGLQNVGPNRTAEYI